MIFDIKVNEDKTVEYSEIIVNQYENEIDELNFTLPFKDFSYVAILKSPNNKKLEVPLTDNKITIDKNITSIAGQWSLIIIGKKEEKIFISNSILLKSCRNFLHIDNIQEMDSNVEFLYLQIQETLNKLNSTGINDISELCIELKTINSKLDNLNNNEKLNKIKTGISEITEQLTSTISKIDNITLNLYKLENIENNILTLNNKIDTIPTKDYTGEFAEIKNLLTYADVIVDEIKGGA